jgi:hypothetical protein
VLIFARTKAEAVTVAEIMQKDDSKSQARTAADSSTGDENNSVSQHNAKPLVVGLPSLSDEYVNVDAADSFINRLKCRQQALDGLISSGYFFGIKKCCKLPLTNRALCRWGDSIPSAQNRCSIYIFKFIVYSAAECCSSRWN